MTAAIGSDRTEGLTVAIVDDDRDMRETLKVVLEDEGFTVLHAPSGLRLIGILSVDRPDLILLDVRMAWVDGFALCRALKASPRFREIPICFLSALS
jgi:CheY-like chemotaxis protein